MRLNHWLAGLCVFLAGAASATAVLWCWQAPLHGMLAAMRENGHNAGGVYLTVEALDELQLGERRRAVELLEHHLDGELMQLDLWQRVAPASSPAYADHALRRAAGYRGRSAWVPPSSDVRQVVGRILAGHTQATQAARRPAASGEL